MESSRSHTLIIEVSFKAWVVMERMMVMTVWKEEPVWGMVQRPNFQPSPSGVFWEFISQFDKSSWVSGGMEGLITEHESSYFQGESVELKTQKGTFCDFKFS